jgi:hypothetical protein
MVNLRGDAVCSPLARIIERSCLALSIAPGRAVVVQIKTVALSVVVDRYTKCLLPFLSHPGRFDPKFSLAAVFCA